MFSRLNAQPAESGLDLSCDFLLLSWPADMIPRMSPIARASLLQSVVSHFLNKQIRQDPVFWPTSCLELFQLSAELGQLLSVGVVRRFWVLSG